jgi:hypothetical protein
MGVVPVRRRGKWVLSRVTRVCCSSLRVATAGSWFGTRFIVGEGAQTRWQVRSEVRSGSFIARPGPDGEAEDFRARPVPRSQWDIRDGRRRRGLRLHRRVGRVAVAGQQSCHGGLARSRVDARRARTPRCDRASVGAAGSGDAQHRDGPPVRRPPHRATTGRNRRAGAGTGGEPGPRLGRRPPPALSVRRRHQ